MKKNVLKYISLNTMFAIATSHAAMNIDTVFIGNADNPSDSTGYGAVSYKYHIGTYEVTNNQYATFLNATATTDSNGLYNSNMGSSTQGGIMRSGISGSYTYTVKSGFEHKPVNFVSFWDAARFTNWLTSGNTETGVYLLTQDGIDNNTITRDLTAWSNGGVAIASEDEWYKAAYHQPTSQGGDVDDYWSYTTASNDAPTASEANVKANASDPQGNPEDVGYSLPSFYGTYDQGGNLWEWTDTIVDLDRVIRGGSFGFDASRTESSYRRSTIPSSENEGNGTGFRISSLQPIPEPSNYAAFLGLATLAVLLGKRNASKSNT